MNYFNEFDPKAAAWLRELMREGLIPEGEVDERDIRQVDPADLRGFAQCHFFGGIGGWSRALQLAGWPDDRPVWTGSCPCQPFSTAGKRKGQDDSRHLWPDWFRLVRECRPPVVFGEQVEGAVRLGWLDGVFADLEGEGYACGAVVLGAHSVGAPHIRQRLFWVADAQGERRAQRAAVAGGSPARVREKGDGRGHADGRGNGGVADSLGAGVRGGGHGTPGASPAGVQGPDGERQRVRADAGAGVGPVAGRLGDPAGDGRGEPQHPGAVVRAAGQEPRGDERFLDADRSVRPSPTGGVGDAEREGRQGEADNRVQRRQLADVGRGSFWSDFELIPCRDGKARRTQPGLFPLADGLPGRVGLLRGAGNAIVPQAAAEFVRAFLETERLGVC